MTQNFLVVSMATMNWKAGLIIPHFLCLWRGGRRRRRRRSGRGRGMERREERQVGLLSPLKALSCVR